jgi:hypothetical protein
LQEEVSCAGRGVGGAIVNCIGQEGRRFCRFVSHCGMDGRGGGGGGNGDRSAVVRVGLCVAFAPHP